MEVVIINVRAELLDGRDFLVANVTMIVPGIMSGNRGPYLYRLSDLQVSASRWNQVPLTLGHPVDKDGNAISARRPEVVDRVGLGHVYNARVDRALHAEAWFNVAKTNRIAPQVLHMLRSGQAIELSTGLAGTIEPTAGVHEGELYQGVITNHQPDHLAILPDAIGACSVRRGCGVKP